MKYLLDSSASQVLQGLQRCPDVTVGQLLTPLTNYRAIDGNVPFAIDNGAFSGLRPSAFRRLLHRMRGQQARCLFVAVPDVVGNAPATWRAFETWGPQVAELGWPLAYVAQDGFDRKVPAGVQTLFIGGTDLYKESNQCVRDVRWAVDQRLAGARGAGQHAQALAHI